MKVVIFLWLSDKICGLKVNFLGFFRHRLLEMEFRWP